MAKPLPGFERAFEGVERWVMSSRPLHEIMKSNNSKEVLSIHQFECDVIACLSQIKPHSLCFLH